MLAPIHRPDVAESVFSESSDAGTAKSFERPSGHPCCMANGKWDEGKHRRKGPGAKNPGHFASKSRPAPTAPLDDDEAAALPPNTADKQWTRIEPRAFKVFFPGLVEGERDIPGGEPHENVTEALGDWLHKGPSRKGLEALYTATAEDIAERLSANTCVSNYLDLPIASSSEDDAGTLCWDVRGLFTEVEGDHEVPADPLKVSVVFGQLDEWGNVESCFEATATLEAPRYDRPDALIPCTPKFDKLDSLEGMRWRWRKIKQGYAPDHRPPDEWPSPQERSTSRPERDGVLSALDCEPGVAWSSRLDERAAIDPESHIGEHCVVQEETSIGFGAFLGHHVILGRNVDIGANTSIGDRAHLGHFTEVGSEASVGKSVWSDSFVKVGPRSDIGPGTRLENQSKIGEGASIGKSCSIAKEAVVGPEAKIGDGALIGTLATIGRGAIVEPGVSVGEFAVVADGAVVSEYLPPGSHKLHDS